MTAPTETKKPARSSRRAGVPAVDQAGSSTSVVDALAAVPTALAVALPLALLHPHPHNPRRDLGDLTELTASIRAHGVRQNLLVVPDPDHPGEWRIVIGHRRDAAARLADLTHVPAVIDEALDDAGQLELMLLENLQRTDLTPVEEADGYQGLLDLGVDVAAIATRTGRSQTTIRARLKLRALPEAAREKVHTHQATIDDALALADFDGDDDLREDLIETFGEPGFTHRLERARQDMSARTAYAAALAELEAAGVKVVEPDEYGRPPAGVTDLRELKGKKRHASMTAEEHADCPGHVAWVYARWGRADVTFGCKGAAKHGHESMFGYGRGTADAGPMTEEQKVERRTLIANNKASDAAQVVRLHWIRSFLKRAKMPDDAPVYVATMLRRGRADGLSGTHHQTAIEWIYAGREVPEDDVDADLARPALATRYLVALALAHGEARMPRDFWHKRQSWLAEERVTHLRQLAAWGYVLADVEQLAIETHTAKAKGRR